MYNDQLRKSMMMSPDVNSGSAAMHKQQIENHLHSLMDFYQKPHSLTNAQKTAIANEAKATQVVRKPIKKEEENVDMLTRPVVKKSSDQLLKMQKFKDEIDASNAQEDQ